MENSNQPTEIADLVTGLEPPYASPAERQIGELLDQYGIPFFYRQPTIIYHDRRNELWKPTFTLPRYGGVVIDYRDTWDPKAINQRLQIYRYNQIPATVLGPRHLDQPNWQPVLYQNIQDLLQRPQYGLDDVMKERSN